MSNPGNNRFLFTCRFCQREIEISTRMIGKRHRCRHCTLVLTVPVPEDWIDSDQHDEDDNDGDEYRLQEEPGPGAPEMDRDDVVHIPIVCSVCTTRIVATEDQVGMQIECPDCYTSHLVPVPTSGKSLQVLEEEDKEELRVSDPIETPRPWLDPDVADLLEHSAEATTGTAPEVLEQPSMERIADVAPTGPEPATWRFLLQLETLTRAVAMWLVGCGVLVIMTTAIDLSNTEEAGYEGAGKLMAAALLWCIFGPLAMLWAAVTCVYGLNVAQHTASDNDPIEGWPEGVWFEWIFESRFVFAALLASAFLPLLFAWLVRPTELWSWLTLGGGVLVLLLFPVILLSMFEADSTLAPFSRSIWGTLFRSMGDWARFHFQVILLLILTAAVTWVAWRLGRWFLGSYVTVPVWSAAAVTGVLVYGRLLGKLTRHISPPRPAPAQPET